jgi:addiction module HigA family antidote
MINEKFLVRLALTQGQLAEAIGVSRKTVNALCTSRRAIRADTALMLATVFGNTADYWLNLQQRNEWWKALNKKSDEHGSRRRKRLLPGSV